MQTLLKTLLLTLFTLSTFCFAEETKISAEVAQKEFSEMAAKIEVSPINHLPLQQNGRIKPLDTMARENLLFISGSYKKFGLDPVQTYLALAAYTNSASLEILEIRDLELRTQLGFLKNKRHYSINDLESSSLLALAEPLFNKQQENARSLNEHEKNILESYHQYSILKEIISGQSITTAADYSFLEKNHGSEAGMTINKELQKALSQYFQNINDPKDMQIKNAQDVLNISKTQKAPDLFLHYLEKMETEIFYNHLRPFFWASLLALFLGFAFLSPLFRNKVSKKMTTFLYLLPMVFIAIGLGLRVYITQFAPITNMFGTMIWVSFGIGIFGFILFILYQNYIVPSMCLISAGLVLMLTEQIPLILSPDLDPIVAVLRSNFWLSTHVTTITISYAAFTIAMVLGNVGLVRLWIYKDNAPYFKEYSHYAYRMIQLGCFLLSVGIILGGVWADYSWGRFWGWDPKETWALIADLGFLAILHGRFAGWISPFSLLAWSPLAYLLVIMAWYGVNFILAAGLHSYGFSSGGATMVAIFVALQVTLLIAGFFKFQTLKQPQHG